MYFLKLCFDKILLGMCSLTETITPPYPYFHIIYMVWKTHSSETVKLEIVSDIKI